MRRKKRRNFGSGGNSAGACRNLALGALLVSGVFASAALAANGSQPVATRDGPVTGFVENGVHEYLGIPYAAPPVGALRWQPPQPPKPWTAPKDATTFPRNCPQNYLLGVFAGPPSTTEDCLYLNVFTTQPGAGKAPVLVWIHGGGLFDGETADYDASRLAKGGPAGPTVVVTIQYRLGLLGYLAVPALDAEGHPFGNYGLLDQQAALRWVRDNIAAFGGDPGNVTLGGQSAGATSTAANMISPGGAGLFRRAIFESGPLMSVPSLAKAEKLGTAVAAAAGCDSGSAKEIAACLRGLSVSRILSLQGTESSNGPYVTGLLVDGKVLPRAGDEAWKTGKFTHMPLMNGTVADEWSFVASFNEYYRGPLTAEQYAGYITKTYAPPAYPKATAAAVAAEYPVGAYPSPSLADIANGTDSLVCKARRLNHLVSRWVPLYAYEFADRHAPWYFPKQSFPSLAAHTIDIQFLFSHWHGGPKGIAHPLSAPEEKLSAELVAAWTNFMYTGNPNGHGNGPWPRYTERSQTLRLQNVPQQSSLSDAQFAAEHRCAFWDGILTY